MTRVAPAALAFLGVLAGCAKQQAAPQPSGANSSRGRIGQNKIDAGTK